MNQNELKGKWLENNENWEERLRQIKERTNRALHDGEYSQPQKPAVSLPILPIKCDPGCMYCHGDGSYSDWQDHMIECPNLRRKRAL